MLHQPRPHPDHPCRQPAAQRQAVRPADQARGRRGLRRSRDGGRDGQGGAPCRRQADGGRHRYRQRRRAAAGRLPDLRAAAHVRLRRRLEAPSRQGVRGIPRTGAVPHPPLPACHQAAERAGGAERAQVSRHQADRERDSRASRRLRGSTVLRNVHDRGVARHHRLHDAQRHYDQRRLSRRARARDAQGISGDPQAPDCCCRSMRPISRWTAPCSIATCRTPSFVKEVEKQVDASTARSRAFRATACGCMSATATGRARTSTTSPLATILPALYTAKVGALSIEFSNPRHAHEYAAFKRIRCRRTCC